MKQDSSFFKALRLIGKLIPGEKLKTAVYLNLFYAPRKMLRSALTGFYRMDHVYEALREFSRLYQGKFSVLEFGVAGGYALVKKLYAVQYLGLEDRVMVHGFDTFQGLPAEDGAEDQALVKGDEWVEGYYRGDYEKLEAHCQAKFRSFELHRGLFEDTVTPRFLQTLEEFRPILVWIDCDYYSSTKTVLERIIPYLPTGCLFYFDDIYYNFSSRFTGEMRAVYEVNHGGFGPGLELVLDTQLSWDSNRIYRFINLNGRHQYQLRNPPKKDPVRGFKDGSPFP